MAKKKITKKPPKKKLSEKAVLPKQAAKKKFAAKTVTKNVAVKKTKVAPKRNVAPKSILAASGIVPPTGWMLIRRVDTGKDYWVDPNTVKDSAPGSPLTDEHKERIKRIVLALHEHYPSLESWYDGMSRELTPENEIQIWERRVAVYQDELADRPSSDAAELHL
ncbi:MAG TPA: hypothetical protein VGX78_19525, partial [Pirellulales bacterium]|nr:hypothetical protein [Pirellulales bacterium]